MPAGTSPEEWLSFSLTGGEQGTVADNGSGRELGACQATAPWPNGQGAAVVVAVGYLGQPPAEPRGAVQIAEAAVWLLQPPGPQPHAPGTPPRRLLSSLKQKTWGEVPCSFRGTCLPVVVYGSGGVGVRRRGSEKTAQEGPSSGEAEGGRGRGVSPGGTACTSSGAQGRGALPMPMQGPLQRERRPQRGAALSWIWFFAAPDPEPLQPEADPEGHPVGLPPLAPEPSGRGEGMRAGRRVRRARGARGGIWGRVGRG